MKTILVAHDEDYVIGCDGRIPWYLPHDLKRFKELTVGQVVIMGRGTWQSLPVRPLPNRQNIIVSTRMVDVSWLKSQLERGAPFVCSNLQSAIQYAEDNMPDREIFIIGGGQIYASALKEGLVDKIIVSKVKGKHKGDVFFPQLGDEWKSKLIEACDGFDVIEFTCTS